MVNVEGILKRVSRRGMSRSCQNRLQQVALQYFSGVDAQQARLKLKLPEEERGYVDIIFDRLNECVASPQIRRAVAEKIANIYGGSPQDLLRRDSEQVFAQKALKYLSSKGVDYHGDKSSHSFLVKLSRDPEFYEVLTTVFNIKK